MDKDRKYCKPCGRDITDDEAYWKRKNGDHYVCLACWGKANRGEIKLKQRHAGRCLYGSYNPALHGDEEYK